MNREQFFKTVVAANNYSAEEIEKIQIAYWLSKDVHRTQTRDSGERYFEHPRRVAINLIEHGWTHPTFIVSALLHDVVEDTNTPLKVIINLFGFDVWVNVGALLKQVPTYCPLSGHVIGKTKKDPSQYWKGINSFLAASVIKLADRLDNLQDLATFTPERKDKYIKETNEYILPIGVKTCPRLTDSIKKALDI